MKLQEAPLRMTVLLFIDQLLTHLLYVDATWKICGNALIFRLRGIIRSRNCEPSRGRGCGLCNHRSLRGCGSYRFFCADDGRRNRSRITGRARRCQCDGGRHNRGYLVEPLERLHRGVQGVRTLCQPRLVHIQASQRALDIGGNHLVCLVVQVFFLRAQVLVRRGIHGRAFFDETGSNADSLGLQIGFEYGPMNATRLGMKGELIRCSVSRGVLQSEAEQGRCLHNETAIGPGAYGKGSEAVRLLFGESRKRADLTYSVALDEMKKKNDRVAKIASAAEGGLLQSVAAAGGYSFPSQRTGPTKPGGFA
jgi:hypothetical protein